MRNDHVHPTMASIINDFSKLSSEREEDRLAQVRSDEVYCGEREDTTVESVQGMQH